MTFAAQEIKERSKSPDWLEEHYLDILCRVINWSVAIPFIVLVILLTNLNVIVRIGPSFPVLNLC